MSKETRNKLVSCLLVLILLLPASLAGCKTETNAYAPEKPQRQTVDVDAIKAKYENSETVTYAAGGLVVERDHEFVIETGFDLGESGFEKFTEIAALYYDKELTQAVPAKYRFTSEEHNTYVIYPHDTPGRYAYSVDGHYDYGFIDGSYNLFPKEKNTDWGNTETMYLATWIDLATSEPLEKPIVQVITVKGELPTPKLSVEIKDGLVRFVWDEIKGAKAYYIVQFHVYDDETSERAPNISSGMVISQVTETSWTSRLENSPLGISLTNKDFCIYRISEDDWLNPHIVEIYESEHDPSEGVVFDEYSKEKYFCVIAVNDEGSSMYSRLIDVKDVAPLAPYTNAYYMQNLTGEGNVDRVQGVNNMPSYRWIVMCDGKLSQRLVEYDFEAVSERTTTWYRYEDVIEDGEWFTLDILEIPYTVEGTGFTGTCSIFDYDTVNWESQLQQIEKRQEVLRSKTGDVKRDVVIDDETVEPGPGPDNGGSGIVDNQTIITANSALSEYLAIQMIDGVKAIDLSDFNEAIDSAYLIDAFSEALYQNPLVLGISGARVSSDKKTLYPLYEDDQATREAKQNEVKAEVGRVVPLIITASMTPLEKEFAINQYLCDTVEYDMAALDNAILYDFKKVDSQYYDSFTAYGALINGVGVCASYAAAFKLLADAAGLDCVVVTGYLNGSMSHAWNRVNLGNGIWAAVDSTNNDNDYMPNVLVNVPDRAAAAALVEDDSWVMDSAKSLYSNEIDTNEYYRVVGLFFDREEVVSQIVDQLKTSDIAVVRTDYMLTEEQFYDIGKEVVLRTGNFDLAGTYWMGLILITSDISIFE